MRGFQRTSVRHVGHPRHQVPADPTHAARGQAGRHLAAAWLCRLYPQTGEVTVPVVFWPNQTLTESITVCISDGHFCHPLHFIEVIEAFMF